MTIHEFQKFIPVCTELGDGYLLYVVDTGMYSNACYAVVLCDGGHIKHFMDHQFTVYPNNTAMITEKKQEDILDETMESDDEDGTGEENNPSDRY